MSIEQPPIVVPAPRKRIAVRRLLSCLCLTAALGSVAAFASEAVYVLLGSNFHVVRADECYRSAQPSLADLQHFAQTYGIRTVINLRGANDDEDWYHAEKEKSRELGLAHMDAGLFGRHPPFEDDLHNLVKALDTAKQPILLHCQSGSDRAGMASAVFLLLRTQTPLAEARKQLSLRFGHNPFGNAACHGKFFDAYARWLDLQKLSHAPDHFRTWARNHYRRCQIVNPCDHNRPPTFDEPPLADFH